MCPWCYIGYRKLQAAQTMWLQKYPNDTFSIRWKPFLLRPDLPRGVSRDKMTAYTEKFGADRIPMLLGRVAEAGEQVGIKFKFGGRIGATRDSHRVIHLAGKLGGEALETKTVEGLFAAYFENEKDLTDLDLLKDVAIKAGIPEAEFQKSIVDSDDGGAEVDRLVMEAQYGSVSGVPDFTIQDKFNFSGAQDPSVFLGVLEKVKALEG
ncbi:putative thioredoxin [Sarocladium strictum]